MANPDTDWIEPDAADVDKVMSQLVLNAAERQSTRNEDDTQRATELLRMSVARIRHAVRRGGRCPISLTPGTVPPEAEQHALVLTAHAMTSSSPNLGTVVVTMQGGVVSPWLKMVQAAEKWLTDVLDGSFIPTYPTDPLQRGDGDELVPEGASYSASSFTLAGLVVGKLYVYAPGPNELSLACGATTLTAAGQFYALAKTAVLTSTGAAGVVFVTASVQLAEAAVNATGGGDIVGGIDMSTDGPIATFPS